MKRMPTEEEVIALLDYIDLLIVYITDDHWAEMEEENEQQMLDHQALVSELME